jgi:hypothetical protein
MSSPVDDELVILNMARDNYIGLDDIGRRIWELLSEPRRVDEVCDKLSLEFEATPDQIAADLLPFLEGLRDEGLIILVE